MAPSLAAPGADRAAHAPRSERPHRPPEPPAATEPARAAVEPISTPGVFVAGTDTSVGKSVVAAAACAALTARGVRVAALKPVITGLDEPPDAFGHDDELLAYAASAGQSRAEVAPVRFGPPVSPHLAAELVAREIAPAALRRTARHAAARADVLIVEGVGGLLVPLTGRYLVRDLAIDLGLDLVIAARPGLGTINHTLLTIAAARHAGIEPLAVVLTPWPAHPSTIERSNRSTIERLSGVPVAALPPTRRDLLAEAGAALAFLDPLVWAASRPPAHRLAA